MGGRAGRLDWGKEEFGRAIFLADSLFAETVLQNIFFKFMKEDSKRHREMISEDGGLYIPALKSGRQPLYRPVKKEKALSGEGKRSYLPFPQFNHKTNRYNFNDWKYQYYNQIGELIADQEEEYKEIYQNILGRDKEKISLDDQDYLSIKKAVLLYDWIGEKGIRELEEEHKIYGGSIQKLGEEFSWLTDSLRTAAENLGWKMDEPSQKNNPLSQEEKTKKDNWEKVKTLAERLNWGVEEEGLKLARLHIPGLSRSYVGALLREGYDDKKCLQELSEEELAKVVPERLVERIKKRYPTVLSPSIETKNDKPETCNPKLESCNLQPETRNLPQSYNKFHR